MDILIEKLIDDTGGILPVKRIDIKSEAELPGKCEYLPNGVYYTSIVDKAGKYQSYYATIIVDSEIKTIKSDCDKQDLESKHGKTPNK